MRLADFILANIEPILEDWEAFAISIWPGPIATRLVLRDHAADMLKAVAMDMKSYQTESQQSEKSKGLAEGGQSQRGKRSDKVDGASNLHASGRLASGFELRELVAEYRALRTSVLQLWIHNVKDPASHHIEDVIRFNEGIDQLLTESISTYAGTVDASRDCFLGILGHDLRTPLASASLVAHLIGEAKTIGPQFHSMTRILLQSLDAMNLLVRDFVDFTSGRLGAKMELTPSTMNLRSLCEEVLDEMRAIHPEHSFIHTGDGDHIGIWDIRRLRQLVSNLLGNAVQHGSSAQVTLTVLSSAVGVDLSVRNTGPVIPAEILSTIFDPMKRHQHLGDSIPTGSVGLGLFIAHEVAAAHGGTIIVSSTHEETVFTVQLPRAAISPIVD
jgi:signal transduction histidine kinase